MSKINRISCALLGAFLLFTSYSPALYAQDITTGLVGHWELDETSGTTAVDSTGNNDGTMGGSLDAANDSVTSIVDTGINFDGTDQARIDVNGAEIINLTTFTACMWFNTDTFTNEDSDTAFFLLEKGWGLVVDNVNTTPILSFHIRTNGSYPYAESTQSLETGRWYHVCAVNNSVGSEPDLYIDGIEEGTAENNGSGTQDDDTAVNLRIGSETLSIFSANFPGTMDDIRLYNRALSATDVKALYQVRSPGTMRYNEKAESIEYYDSDEWIHAGRGSYAPNAVTFDGGFDQLIYNADFPDVTDGSMFTGSFWFRRNGNYGSTNAVYRNNSRFIVGFNAGNQLAIRGEAAGGVIRVAGASSTTYTDSDWHHALFSFDITDELDTSKRHIYIDDVAVDTWSTWDDASPIDFANGANSIGSYVDGSQEFDGDLADLWFDFNTYTDLSVEANRRKFISANSMPMNLGNNGFQPTGQAPDIFLSGDTADWHLNKGTGGGFTENGALTDAPTNAGQHLQTWEQVGNGLAMGGVSNTAITALSPSTIAYIDVNNDDLRTYSWDGTDWSQVGNDLNLSGLSASPPTMSTLTPATIAFADATNDELRTYSWDGTDWSQVGNGLSIVNMDWPALATLDETTVALRLLAPINELRTYSWDGTDWSQVGNGFGSTGLSYMTEINENTIALALSNSNALRTYDWDGTDWSQVGNSLSLSIGSAHPSRLSDNRIALWRHNGVSSTEELEVYDWDGTDWTQVGQGLTITGSGIGDIDALNSSTVAYIDDTLDNLRIYQFAHCNNPDKAKGTIIYNSTDLVMQYCNGADWVAMGPTTDTGGAGCINPTGVAGAMIYNDDYDIMQYCNSQDWIGIGKNIYSLLNDSLVGHWTMDDTSGSTIVDSSGNGNDGTWSDSSGDDVAEESLAGMIDTAIDFDGTDDFATVVHDDLLDVSNTGYTFATWVYFDSVVNLYDPLISKNDNGGWGDAFTISMASVFENKARLFFCHDRVFGNCRVTDYIVPYQKWAHVAVTWDGVDIKTYVNGGLMSTIAYVAVPDTSTGDLRIAKSRINWGIYEIDGKMDDARFYNRVLGDDEIAYIYELTTPSDITSGLQGHWRLDETSGLTAADSSGNGNDGTWNGSAVVETTTGQLDGAYLFDDLAKNVEIPYNVSLASTAEMSVAFWGKFDDINGGDRIIWRNETNGFIVNRLSGSGNLAFGFFNTANRTLSFSPTLGQWQHFVITYNESDDSIKLYVDGDFNILTDLAGNSLSASTGDIYFSSSDTSRTWPGALDDVRIYGRELSGPEVSDLYGVASASSPTAGLVAHWPLDETSGSSIADIAGTNTGTWTDGTGNDVAEETTAGVVGTAIDFDGSNDDIDIGTSNILWDSSGPASASFWAKTDTVSAGGGNPVTLMSDQAEPFVVWFASGGSNGGINFGGNNGFVTMKTVGDISPSFLDEWKHVVVTYDGVDETNISSYTLYIDGVLTSHIARGGWAGLTNQTLIGNSGAGHYFDGDIDDVRVYNRALTASQISDLYNAGTIPYSPNAVTFDGSNDYLTTALTLPDTKVISGSFWVRRNVTGTDQRIIDNSGNGDFDLRITSANRLSIIAKNSASAVIVQMDSDTITDTTNWHHILFSFDLANAGNRHIYIDGVESLNSVTTYTDDTMDLDNGTYAIGARTNGANKLDADMSQFWVDSSNYIDFSIQANRDDFYNNGPLDMGADGSGPTGSSPAFFLDGATASWHTNKGTGGGFTESGALTDSVTDP